MTWRPALGEPTPPGIQPSFVLRDDAARAMSVNGRQGLRRMRTKARHRLCGSKTSD